MKYQFSAVIDGFAQRVIHCGRWLLPTQGCVVTIKIESPIEWVKKPFDEMTIVEVATFLDAMENRLREVGARNSSADLGLIQQIHDLTHELGAECSEYEDDDGSSDEDMA